MVICAFMFRSGPKLSSLLSFSFNLKKIVSNSDKLCEALGGAEDENERTDRMENGLWRKRSR